MLVKTR